MIFASYLKNPKNYHFEGQDADEKILLLLRAHPIINLSWIIPALVIFFLPFILPGLLPLLGIDLSLIPEQFVLTGLVINYLLVLVITFEGFLNWYFNVNIVTNKRIYDIDFESILRKRVDLAPVSMVQEANSTVGGVLGLVFHFGTVLVQTAGAKVAIDFHNVPHPDQVADFIMDQAHKSQGGKDADL